MFEGMRRNHVRAAEYIRALASVAYEHDLALWKTLAFFLEGWSAWHAGDRNAGLVQMRAGVAQLAEREISLFSGLIRTELAQAEAESGEVDGSLLTLENALVCAERMIVRLLPPGLQMPLDSDGRGGAVTARPGRDSSTMQEGSRLQP